MLNRFFLSVMIVTSAFTLIFGQDATKKADTDKNDTKEFSFYFDGNGSYLGVGTSEVTRANLAKLGLKDVRGVVVDKVMENSPAAAAGLQVGDVIVKFNGEEVTSSRKLTRLVGEVDPDHQAKITVIRGGSERELTATIGKMEGPKWAEGNLKWDSFNNFNMPDMKDFQFKLDEHLKNLPDMKDFQFKLDDHLKNMPDMKEFKLNLDEHLKNMPDMKQFKLDLENSLKNLPDMKDWKFNMPDLNFDWQNGDAKGFTWFGGRQIGAGVTPLTKQLADKFGVKGGAMINDVRDDSPAAKAGLKAGDIIVEADGKEVNGDVDLVRLLNSKREGDVQLTIVRDGKRQTVTVTPEASKDGGYFYHIEKDDSNPPVFLKTPAAKMVTPAPMIYKHPTRVI